MTNFTAARSTSEEDSSRNNAFNRYTDCGASPDEISSIDEGNRSIDHILDKIVGGGGWGQWIIVIASYPIIYCSMSLLMHMFTAFEPSHRCYIPACDNETSNVQALWLDFAIPTNHTSNEMLKSNEKYDPCNMYEFVGTSCSAGSFNRSKIVQCDKYVYDTFEFEETLTTKLNLVCNKEHKRRFLSTIMMMGLTMGSLVGGRLSDRFGRKVTMLAAVMVVVPVVTFSGYAPSYEVYALLRLISCTCLPFIWICCNSLHLEIFGTNHRKSVVIAKDFTYPTGQSLLILFVYFNRSWTYLHVSVGLACAFSLFMFFIIPESVRWLAINGKRYQAEKVLVKIAKRNGRTISNRQMREIKTILQFVEKEAHLKKNQENLNPIDMFRESHLKVTFIMMFNWITVCVGTYTLILNTTKLSGDIYINWLLSTTLGDIPGTMALILTLKYFGRRFNLFYTQFILGFCCLVLAFLPKSNNSAILVFYLIGKCAGGAGFLLIWLMTAELYPTNLRSQAVGTLSMISRIFGALAPFVATLSVYWKPLPMLLLGCPCLIAGTLVYFLPETRNSKLPQTLNESEKMEGHTLQPRFVQSLMKMDETEKDLESDL